MHRKISEDRDYYGSLKNYYSKPKHYNQTGANAHLALRHLFSNDASTVTYTLQRGVHSKSTIQQSYFPWLFSHTQPKLIQ